MDQATHDESVYSKLAARLPDEAVERTKGAITRKGYDTTGYGYQFVVNRLNEVLGVDGWTFSYEIEKSGEGAYSSGAAFYDVTVRITITIFGGRDVTRTCVDVTRTCVGGHRSATYADALKGAITNGFKKTAALFGVGKHAYEGTVDDDNVPADDGNAASASVNARTPRSAQSAPTRATAQPGANEGHVTTDAELDAAFANEKNTTAAATAEMASTKQLGLIASLVEQKHPTQDRHGIVSLLLGRKVTSGKELTKREATVVIEKLMGHVTPKAPPAPAQSEEIIF